MEIDSPDGVSDDRWLSRLTQSQLRGVAIAGLAGLLLGLSCLMNWATVHVFVVFQRTYAGTHFREGRVVLGVAIAAVVIAALAAKWFRAAIVALPLLGAAALALTTWKYHDIGSAFDSSRRAPVATASADSGLVLAVPASALLFVAGVWSVADLLQGFRLRLVRSS